jgi:hypothetical protein
LGDEVWNLALALEEYAREWKNHPLLALLERARFEFTERKTFLDEQLKSMNLATR